MENKKTKETAKRLGKDERYNACPKCGSEVYLYIDESGEYCVGCVECEEHNISTYLLHTPEKNEVDVCRTCWNLWTTGGAYFPEALDKMSVHQGDYVVANTSDGFIEFSGNAAEMFKFLETQDALNDQTLYTIHTVINGRLVNLGLSCLVELSIKHCKAKE